MISSLDIRHDFEDILKHSNLRFKFLSSLNIELLKGFYSKVSWLPIEVSHDWRAYQILYHSQAMVHTDLSVAILNESQEIIALWYLDAFLDGEEIQLTNAGKTIQAPIFADLLNSKLISKTSRMLLQSVIKFAKKYNMSNLLFEQISRLHTEDKNLSPWQIELMKNGASTYLNADSVINIPGSINEIKPYIRKSYKPLISKGLRELNLTIMSASNNTQTTWSAFRQLHFESAGNRSTRSSKTWCFQYELIARGKAFLSIVYANSKMVGGSFVMISRDEAIYAVGAYDRALGHMPLGHVAQWSVIQELICLQIPLYRLGNLVPERREDLSIDKDFQISHFKDGFATGHRARYSSLIKI